MGAMHPEPVFTRREGDQLARRVDSIDEHGTRGMQLISQQTQNNTAAIAAMRSMIESKFTEHTRQHETELAAIAGRKRWRVTAVAAVIASAAAALGLLVDIAAQVGHL